MATFWDPKKRSRPRHCAGSGRGGAGFTTGIKWEACHHATGNARYVVCNADEGEPGTFKDGVLLARRADALFEGMTIAAHVIGARRGLVYLRGEYRFLLESLLAGLELSGLVISGPPGEPRLGANPGAAFTLRVKQAPQALLTRHTDHLAEVEIPQDHRPDIAPFAAKLEAACHIRRLLIQAGVDDKCIFRRRLDIQTIIRSPAKLHRPDIRGLSWPNTKRFCRLAGIANHSAVPKNAREALIYSVRGEPVEP